MPTIEELELRIAELENALLEMTVERDIAIQETLNIPAMQQQHAADLLRYEEAARQRETEIDAIRHEEYRKGFQDGKLAERNRG
ncbi:hypothetical protein Spp001_28 [Shewanella phage Spp001]|uniref:Uncharacterized protein n=1 Tax=Shewanella phage Spp001 TaxID=1445859 RepID=W6E9H6_9CAUD|nr:hypothetical protein Spp001_28 [Shewanella phage Spp001]AHJ10536.1 hypothetical protein Spp001_28 [Shewanella phage Spp001]